jgi:hypothetical protein
MNEWARSTQLRATLVLEAHPISLVSSRDLILLLSEHYIVLVLIPSHLISPIASLLCAMARTSSADTNHRAPFTLDILYHSTNSGSASSRFLVMLPLSDPGLFVILSLS